MVRAASEANVLRGTPLGASAAQRLSITLVGLLGMWIAVGWALGLFD